MASRVANFIIMVGLGLYSTLRFRMVSDYPASLILMKFIDLFLIFSIVASHLALGRLMDRLMSV